MSDFEPKEPYVYQPFGMQDRDHWSAERIYAVGGLHHLATVKGLTRDEADRFLAALKGPTIAELQGKIALLRNAARGGNAAMPAQSPLLNEAGEVLRHIEQISAFGYGAQNSENRRKHLRSVNEIARALLSKLEGGK